MKDVKVKYDSEKSAKAAESDITRLIELVNGKAGDAIPYKDVCSITLHLRDYRELLEKSRKF